MPADKFLPAIGHAISGATGTAISTTATYPLDLVNTRLKVQRQFQKDGTISPSEQYEGVSDAFSKIYEREGGIKAFYAGLGSDVAKSVADSFLFFLFYTWFRSRRSQANRRRLPVWEELAVGAAAGACARVFTTPISNVVTRKQTASFFTPSRSLNGKGDLREPSFAEILHVIRAEKGFLGLWAGYGATLALTLNPSITFYLQHALRKALIDRGRQGESSVMVFLVAALSKVIATATTYPFNIAKARAQVSAPPSPRSGPEEKDPLGGGSLSSEGAVKFVRRHLNRLAGETIFASVAEIRRTEGTGALYDGLPGELLKAFFNHGTTMLSKEIVHKLIVQLYLVILAFMRKSPSARELFARTSGKVLGDQRSGQIAGRYGAIKDSILRGALVVSLLEWYQKRTVVAR